VADSTPSEAEKQEIQAHQIVPWAGLLVSITFVLYPLGALSVAREIQHAYHLGWAASLFAVSLVPKEVVVWHGVRRGAIDLLGAFVFMALVNYYPPYALLFLPRRVRSDRHLGVKFAAMFVFVGTAVSAVGVVFSWRLDAGDSALVIVASGAVWLAIVWLALRPEITRAFWISVSVPLLWGRLLLPLLLTAKQAPTLPLTTLTLTNRGHVNGQLLNHSTGSWYVLVKGKNTIQVIPDVAVKSALIH
jgi:hypothetical protein